MANSIDLSCREKDLIKRVKMLRAKTKSDFLEIFVEISMLYSLAAHDDTEYIQNHVFELLRMSIYTLRYDEIESNIFNYLNTLDK